MSAITVQLLTTALSRTRMCLEDIDDAMKCPALRARPHEHDTDKHGG